eukprot:8476130-Lingulodinium_polyedra.AAC.1
MACSPACPQQGGGNPDEGDQHSRISTHGPPKELITDNESGIVISDRTREYLARQGAKVWPRAKDQHAKNVERRGA